MLALSPRELVELLVTLPALRTPFIWGPPGIGKSALVREAAELLGLPCVTLLGTQLAPEDLIGVPRIRELSDERFVTEFCPPRAILRDAPYLLFIDELNSAVADVQKAFYSLILDRRLGEYALPTGSRVVGAGNRIEDRALVRPMATALSNRMLHLGLEPSAEAWLIWAARQRLHPLVMAFVRARPDLLYQAPPTDAAPAYPTPRAWHMLSDALIEVPDELWPALAAGSVGDGAGAQFSAFAKRALLAPSLEDLAAGRAAPPNDPDLIYFLGASCIGRLSSDDEAVGVMVAKALGVLGEASMEVAVWTLDAALRGQRRGGARRAAGDGTAKGGERSAASHAFEKHVRATGSRVLVDVLRLGRFAEGEDG